MLSLVSSRNPVACCRIAFGAVIAASLASLCRAFIPQPFIPSVSIRKSHVTLKSRIEDPDFEISIGEFKIVSHEDEVQQQGAYADRVDSFAFDRTIRLYDIKSGWGNGAHPTTRLCLDFLTNHVKLGDQVLDYGTGSGILAIVAAKLGARKCIAVDIDEDTLIAAERNAAINGVVDKFDVIHTRTVYFGDDRFSPSDITISNILAGPLTRLAAQLWMMTKPGGWLCLSGMRAEHLAAVRRAYAPVVDLSTESTATDSHPIFGEWIRWTVRTKSMSAAEQRAALLEISEATLDL